MTKKSETRQLFATFLAHSDTSKYSEKFLGDLWKMCEQIINFFGGYRGPQPDNLDEISMEEHLRFMNADDDLVNIYLHNMSIIMDTLKQTAIDTVKSKIDREYFEDVFGDVLQNLDRSLLPNALMANLEEIAYEMMVLIEDNYNDTIKYDEMSSEDYFRLLGADEKWIIKFTRNIQWIKDEQEKQFQSPQSKQENRAFGPIIIPNWAQQSDEAFAAWKNQFNSLSPEEKLQLEMESKYKLDNPPEKQEKWTDDDYVLEMMAMDGDAGASLLLWEKEARIGPRNEHNTERG